jgi:hypothetical protein
LSQRGAVAQRKSGKRRRLRRNRAPTTFERITLRKAIADRLPALAKNLQKGEYGLGVVLYIESLRMLWSRLIFQLIKDIGQCSRFGDERLPIGRFFSKMKPRFRNSESPAHRSDCLALALGGDIPVPLWFQ